jgi:hypothetical protein
VLACKRTQGLAHHLHNAVHQNSETLLQNSPRRSASVLMIFVRAGAVGVVEPSEVFGELSGWGRCLLDVSRTAAVFDAGLGQGVVRD